MKANFYLSLRGIIGRKRQNFLLVMMIILSIVFSVSYLIYNQSSLKSLEETRRNLYGEWYTTTYNVIDPVVSQEGVSSIVEQYALICDNNIILGSVGKVDDNFEELGRIQLLNGKLPTRESEIALTTSLLDSLGYSYDLDKFVKIPVLPMDYDTDKLQRELVETKFIEYKLVGILPAYDVFWQKNETPLVNAIVSDSINNYSKQYQILWKGSKAFESYKLMESANKDIVINEFAYPIDNSFDYSLMMIQIGIILLTFVSNLIIYSLLLNKRKKSFVTMSNLGSTRPMIIGVVIIESLLILTLSFVVGIPIGLLIGVLITSFAKNAIISIPYIQIIIILVSMYFVCFTSFLISAMMIRIDNPDTLRNEKTKILKKVEIASKPKLTVILLIIFIFITSIGTLYFTKWQMMPYEKNVSYAALNIQSKSEKFFDGRILDDLKKIPEVKEISAINFVPLQYFVTSKDIRENEAYDDIYDASFETPPINFYKRGILLTNFYVLSNKECDLLAASSDMNEEEAVRFKNGEGVIYYQAILEKDNKTGMVYNFISVRQNDEFELLELPVEKGSMLALTSNQFVDEEGYDYTKSNVFENDIEVLGVLPKLNDQLLFGNELAITNGSIFISQEFYKKLMLRMEERRVTEDEYTNINLTIDENASFATRKSIASIVTSRGGILQSDTYELVDKLYRECTQKALIVALSGSIASLFGLILLCNIVSSSLLVERKRIGILQGLGCSKKQLINAYLMKIIKIFIPTIIIVNGLVLALVSYINQPKYLIEFIRIFVYGYDIYFEYPIRQLIILNLLLIFILLLVQLYPLYKMIKNEPIENMKESGGV